MAYVNLKKYEAAISDFTKVLEIEPSTGTSSNYRVMSFYNRGLSYFKSRKFEAAIADFESLIKIAPDSNKEEIKNLLAETKKIKEEEAKYNTRNEYYNLGIEQREQGKFDEAIVSASKCLELDSVAHSCYLLRGLSYYSKLNFDAAIKDFTECIRLKPSDAQNYRLRAENYIEKKNYDAAIKDLSSSFSLKYDRKTKERIDEVKQLKEKENNKP
ncbi:MAG: tetratricopeptide repeat protein [Blastocatellia bacterium]|nr:tetratricopeptide repeat protein [Blastocatellia bacterium]